MISFSEFPSKAHLNQDTTNSFGSKTINCVALAKECHLTSLLSYKMNIYFITLLLFLKIESAQ